ncbi:MAG TPA: hypothetical protein PLJ89_07410, partial [Thermoleophilia bacterium]|nr:hypothetical protein [Thermoleophilia bacterium]
MRPAFGALPCGAHTATCMVVGCGGVAPASGLVTRWPPATATAVTASAAVVVIKAVLSAFIVPPAVCRTLPSSVRHT